MEMDFLDRGYRLDLTIDPPLCNAPGMLGFAPDTRSQIEWRQFGAFFTNPISWQPRSPARGLRYHDLPGGFMLHTGHPNPGFHRVVREYAGYWSRSDIPVVVSLLVDEIDALKRMIERLETLENVRAVELGFPPAVDAGAVRQGVHASMGELPVIARLPFEAGVKLAAAAVDAGASAVSLQPPRVLLPSESGFASGRMYGQGVYPLLLERSRRLAAEDVPLIAGGGVYTVEQAQALVSLGCKVVQLDAVLWREPGVRFRL